MKGFKLRGGIVSYGINRTRHAVRCRARLPPCPNRCPVCGVLAQPRGFEGFRSAPRPAGAAPRTSPVLGGVTGELSEELTQTATLGATMATPTL